MGAGDDDSTVTVQVNEVPTVTSEAGQAKVVEVVRRTTGVLIDGFPTTMLVPVSWSTGTSPHTVLAADAGGTWMFVASVHGPAGCA